MELVLYYIKESSSLIVSFLILIFVLGILTYLSIRKFRQDSKIKVMFYGLFMGLKNIDIVKLAIVVLRTFLVFYATIVLQQEKVYICLIMIAILSLIYIIINPKKIVYEIVCTVMELVIIYFVFTINNYMVEIELSTVTLMIKTSLIIFAIILTTYMLLRDINLIVDNRWNKEFDKNRKEFENGN